MIPAYFRQDTNYQMLKSHKKTCKYLTKFLKIYDTIVFAVNNFEMFLHPGRRIWSHLKFMIRALIIRIYRVEEMRGKGNHNGCEKYSKLIAFVIFCAIMGIITTSSYLSIILAFRHLALHRYLVISYDVI